MKRSSPAAARQRRLYDQLWTAARAEAHSPDLMRFRVWRPHLVPPVVDVGAGDALLARSFPEIEVLSVDLSDVGIRRSPGKAAVGSAEALPIASAAMRTVVLSEILEHTDEPTTVLLECRRILVPQGRLLLSTPLWPIAPAAWLYFWRRIRERPTLANMDRWDPQHERRFLLQELQARVRAAGLEIEHEIPLFGSASSAAFYLGEPVAARITGRTIPLAHRLTEVDRLFRAVDRPSSMAMICRPVD